MPVIIACPSCGGKLRVADALRGQRVRCPACNHTFDSEAPPPPPTPPAPQDLPLQLALDDPSSPSPPAPSTGQRGLIGAVEVKLSLDNDSPSPPRVPDAPPTSSNEDDNLKECPVCGKLIHRDSTRCYNCGERFGQRRYNGEIPDLRRRQPRRDAVPDRGAIVLSLGIVSLAGTVVYCAAPLWAILGLAAWIMGQSDLRKMKSGEMDDNGRGMTQGGLICGIIGLLLNGLMTLLCGGIIGMIVYTENTRPPNTRPIPITRPPQPAPPKKGFPAPKQPPAQKF